MQLLYSQATPSPEFVSLSLLLKSDISGDQVTCRMGEPLLLPSPVSTAPNSMCVQALKELHQYINSVFKSSRSSKETQADKMSADVFLEDEKLLNDVQVFRPLRGHGLGLHYRLIRDRSAMSQFISLVFNASKATASSGKGVENEVTGVVLCVGMAGLPSAFAMSSLHYSLSQRMRDCLDILTKAGTEDARACRALLSTLLLTEDEDRVTNAMAEGVARTLLSEGEDLLGDKKGGKSGINVLIGGKKKSEGLAASENEGASFFMNSADQARILVERLAVLSVAENDTIFRKYEAKMAGEKASKAGRRRKTGRDADLDGFDFKGTKRSSMREPATPKTTTSLDSSSSLKSSGSKLQLPQPKKDTNSRVLLKSRQGSVPALMASLKDSGSRNRRSSVDNAPRTTTQRRKSNGQESTSDWLFDNGNGVGAQFSGQGQSARTSHDGDSTSSGKTPPGSIASRGSRNRQNNFDPFASYAQSEGTATTATESTVSSRGRKGMFEDEQELGKISETDAMFGTGAYGDDMGFDDDLIHSSAKSSRSLGLENSEGITKVQVNVALNEDLTCFYKLSKMSSCSVEGVVQVRSVLRRFLLLNQIYSHASLRP